MSTTWTLPEILTGPVEAAVAVLNSYFGQLTRDGLGPYFTGAMFERFAAGGDPHVIGYEDLIAVTMLGVDMPASASLRILIQDREEISRLLRQVPVDLELVDAPPDTVGPTSAAWQLWRLVDGYHNVGTTLTSKLLARKRPLLLPVQDRVVIGALSHHQSDDFWALMRICLTDNDRALYLHMRNVRAAAGLDDDISVLRVFDILVWMTNRRQ